MTTGRKRQLLISRGRCPIYIKRLSRADKKTSEILVLLYYERNEATSIHAHVNSLGDSDSNTDEADATVTHAPRSLRINNTHLTKYRLWPDHVPSRLFHMQPGRQYQVICTAEIISPVDVFYKRSAAMSTIARKRTYKTSPNPHRTMQRSPVLLRTQGTEHRENLDLTSSIALIQFSHPQYTKRQKRKKEEQPAQPIQARIPI